MPQHIRIMTYNVHSCIGMDGKTSTERIAEVIYRAGADVVALQEVDTGLARTGFSDQAREIATILNMQVHFHPSLYREAGAYGNALLSRFPMLLRQGGALPSPPGLRRFEKRGVLWAAVSFPERSVQLIATHFGLVRLERILQVLTLLGPEWLGHPECSGPVVICGDFNSLPRSQVYRRMVDRFHDVQHCLAGWRPKKTWPSKYPVVRIDHIFISPDFTVEEIAVPRDQLTGKASDHLPLIVAVHLRESSQGDEGEPRR